MRLYLRWLRKEDPNNVDLQNRLRHTEVRNGPRLATA